MMELALLLAATVSFTAPDSAATDTTCTPSTSLSEALSHITLWGQTSYTEPRVLGVRPANSGQPDSVTFADHDSLWTVWTVVTDVAGRNSCESARLGVNWTTSISPEVLGARVLFDINGRRVMNPKAPGIYFERSDGRSWKIVVLK